MILVAENLTVTHPTMARAIAMRDPAPLIRLAQYAQRGGATVLDVNLGPRSRDAIPTLEFVLGTLRANWQGDLWIDAVDVEVMEAAARLWLGSGPGRVTLNGYAGGREGVIELAARLGLELVVFLMDSAVPASANERLALAAEYLGRCGEASIGPERIIIDPVLAPLGWMDGQARNAELFELLRQLPALFGPDIRSVVGLSNLVTRATGQARVGWLEEVFLAGAAGAGLTHVMLDIEDEGLLRVCRALEVFSGHRPFAPADFDFPTK